eukprot:14306257-Alexandrium_andersonii.AAC.1
MLIKRFSFKVTYFVLLQPPCWIEDSEVRARDCFRGLWWHVGYPAGCWLQGVQLSNPGAAACRSRGLRCRQRVWGVRVLGVGLRSAERARQGMEACILQIAN